MGDDVVARVDIERVRRVLRDAVEKEGFSQRGLSRAAELNRDAVYDIINGRNKNPTVAVLVALANAMDKDLSVFGIEISTSISELERAIAEALPSMPSRSVEKQARFLAQVVAGELGLPPDQPANDHPPLRDGDPAAA